NSLTRARKVAGPTFSLLINLSQARRCRRLRRVEGLAVVTSLELRFANARLLASRQPLDIGGVANVEKDGQRQEQHREMRLAEDEQRAEAGETRRQCRER